MTDLPQQYNAMFAAVSRYSANHLAAGDVYTAGAAIRWLKQLGPWNDRDIIDRIIPCYPQVIQLLQTLAM